MKILAILVLSIAAALPVHGQFELPGKGKDPSSVAHLLAEPKAVAAGRTFTLAFEIDQPDGWHSYYKNSGGVEQSPELTWTLPPGFTAGPIQWPVPAVEDGYFGKSFLYEADPVFLVDITAPANLAADTPVKLALQATWQICKPGKCTNETAALDVTLPVGGAVTPDPANLDFFAKARAKIPAKAAPDKVMATAAGDHIVLRIPAAEDAVDFVPDQRYLFPASAGGKLTRDGDTWLVELKRATKDAIDPEKPIPQGRTVSGILTGSAPVAIPETMIGLPEPKSAPAGNLLKILGAMLLGGLILNLMPCVFPVIGLKILGFVQQAGSERRKIILHGLSFTTGVLLSFGVLSAGLFAARLAASAKGSDAVGWGYQLQNPWMVCGLMLLMFVMALSMFGVFEIGVSATSAGGSLQSKHGLMGSFFSGLLATVVATPCSGPIIGPAIGAAIVLPGPQFFAAFTAMAVGLSLPYLVLSVFPKLVDYLPRPGAWMESFKQAISFLLFASAGWLLWVYSSQIGEDNSLNPVFGLTAVAVAAWIYGRWCLPHRKRITRIAGIAFATAFAAIGLYLVKPPAKSALTWETWSQARVDELLKDGKPVYIDFTAHWCASCQFNKKRAYTPGVIKLMKERNVVALRADKTNPVPEIDAKIREYGRGAVPVNVLLVPGKQPVITPEILSPDYLTDLFTKEVPAPK